MDLPAQLNCGGAHTAHVRHMQVRRNPIEALLGLGCKGLGGYLTRAVHAQVWIPAFPMHKLLFNGKTGLRDHLRRSTCSLLRLVPPNR